MNQQRGQWPRLLARASSYATCAVELSALSEPELPLLLQCLRAHRPRFSYVAVHAPTKQLSASDAAIADLLHLLPPWVDTVVVHPDVVRDFGPWRELGSLVSVENMDVRKGFGSTVKDLETVFRELPNATFCFDVPHAASVDPTLRLAMSLIDAFGSRLQEIHLSTLDSAAHHVALTQSDAERFQRPITECPPVPIILEAEPPEWMWTHR